MGKHDLLPRTIALLLLIASLFAIAASHIKLALPKAPPFGNRRLDTGHHVRILAPVSNEPVWEQTNGPPGGSAMTVAVDPVMPNILYAGMQDGGVFRSSDCGEHWESVIFKPDSYVSTIAATPYSVFAASCNLGFYRSDDHGASWHEVEVAHETRVCSVYYSPHGGVLLVSTQDGQVFVSLDGGGVWREVTGDLPREEITTMGAAGTEEYWVGQSNRMNGGLYHTTDGGRHWERAGFPQPPDTDVSHVLVANDDPNLVLVGLRNVHNEGRPEGHIYSWLTRDGGASWQPIQGFFDPDNGCWPLAQGPDGAIYVNNANHLYRSRDRGRTWEHLPLREGLIGRKTGDFGRMAIDPTDPDILYVPVLNGVAKSTDGGSTWAVKSEGMILTRISLLAAHPTDPGTIYAASAGGEGTFRSTDYGEHWTWLNGGGITHPWADELVISPHDPETVWEVADVADVFVTNDGGTYWTRTIHPHGDGFRFGSVYALAPAPSDPDTIYALKNGFGIFKSTDGGTSWRFLHQSEVDYTYSIAVHPTNPDIVYSGYSPKPFQDWAMVRKTTDGGDSWQTVLSVPHSSGITSVAIDPNDPDTVYAGSTGKRGEIYKSTDGGDSWSKLNEHFIMCTVWGQPQLIIDPNNPSIAYAATWLAGTWKTEDAGETWTLLEEAPISSTALSLNAQDTDVIYLADRSSPTVWKSTDAGSTWEKIADFSGDGALLVMRVLADGNTVYASTFHPNLTGGKLYKSTDFGSTWTDITGTLPKGILDVAVDPTNPDIVYVTTNIYGVYKSTDGGTTWAKLENFPYVGVYDIEVDPVDPTIVYASARGGSLPSWFTEIAGIPDGITFTDDAGVYKSTDSGVTWTQILTTTASCRVIRLHPDNHNVLFAVDLVDGLQVSTDGGNSWTSYNTGLDTVVLTSCAVGGDKIYVGTQGCGVYSGDFNMGTGMVTWQPGRSNKPVPEVYSLQIAVDPANSSRIFVSSYPGGLFRSDDGGATFRDKNGITPSVVVDDPRRQGYYTFAINPSDTSKMWLGTWGKGIFKSYNAMSLDIPANGTDMKMYGKHIYQIVIDPNPPNTIYAATEEGVFKSSDGGATWSDFSTGLDTPQIRTLAMTADGTLLCGSLGYELYYYDAPDDRWRQMNAFGNFGVFWPIWDDRPLYQYTSLLFHPTDPDIIYLGTFPAGIYKSTDGGQSWRESNVGWTNDGVFSLVFHPENPDIIYAGTYNGLNRSTDGGAHWEMWDQGWPDEQWVFSIDFDPRDPNVMYACSKNGENEGRGREGFHGTVMKSTDGGAHWFPIITGLNVNQEFYKIIVDKRDPDTLYLATQGEGVFISRDGGAHWLPWNEGLTNLVAGTNGNNVTNTMVQSADGVYLYFGSAGSGVFRRMTVTFDHFVYLPLILKSWH